MCGLFSNGKTLMKPATCLQMFAGAAACAVQLHDLKCFAACAQEPAVRDPMLPRVAFSAMARL